MRELALEVLGEVPDSFVDYMVMKDNEPDQLYKPSNEKVESARDQFMSSFRKIQSSQDKEQEQE